MTAAAVYFVIAQKTVDGIVAQPGKDIVVGLGTENGVGAVAAIDRGNIVIGDENAAQFDRAACCVGSANRHADKAIGRDFFDTAQQTRIELKIGAVLRGVERIITGAALIDIGATADHEAVVACAAIQDIAALAARQRVIARAAIDDIVTIATGKDVICGTANHRVVAVSTVDIGDVLKRDHAEIHHIIVLELVLVLLLMGLTIGLMLPRMGAGVKRMEEREFLQDVVHTLKRAHIRAMSSGQTEIFRIRGSERRYGLYQPPAQLIPENVDIYSDILEQDPETGDRIVLFYSDGSVSDNDLKIVFDRQRTFFIFIHPISATIRVVERKSS